jgi:hypothetical protein
MKHALGRIGVVLLATLGTVRIALGCTSTGGTCSIDTDCCSKLCVSSTCVASDRHIVYAEDYASCTTPPCSGKKSDPWVGSDGAGGIQDALDACPSSHVGTALDKRDGCTVILPKGYVTLTSSIVVDLNSYTAEEYQDGLVFRGHGSGQHSSSTTDSLAGTTLIWAGDAGGTVIRVAYTSWSKFEDFSIDGGGSGFGSGTAGVGIELTSGSCCGPTQKNQFRNIYIANIDNVGGPGTPGYGIGIRISPESADYQISENSFEDVVIASCKTGVAQDGSQTVNNVFKRVDVYAYDDYGMDFLEGNVLTEACTFIPESGGTAKADVRLHNSPDLINAVFDSNYHETKKGTSYLFDAGTARIAPSTFINTRILWFQDQAGCSTEPCPRPIDYQQTGSLNLIGCRFDVSGSSSNGYVDVNTPSGGAPAHVASFGNLYPSSPGVIKLRIQGNASLASNDDPLQLGTQVNSKSTQHYFNAGFLFENGSMNWKSTGSSIKYKQELNGDVLRMLDGSNNVLNFWDLNGGLNFDTTSAKLAFKSTVVQASSPSTSATVTVPSVTDTLVGKQTTDTLTNKTYDVEATGNAFTGVEKRFFPVGACMQGTGRPMWNAPLQTGFSLTCAGSNTVRMIEAYADTNAVFSIFQTQLPSDWSGSIDFTLRWYSNTTSGSAVWQVATACAGDGAGYDPSFNSYQTVTDASKGTANQFNDAAITGLTTTGCSAGSTLFVKVYRDPAHASDSLAATANLISAELVLRRAM